MVFMSEAEVKRRMHAIVSGFVQGVGFRHFVYVNASNLGVTGWVRNRWDGSVEVVAEGDQAQLESLLAILRRGPRAAHVDDVEVHWEEASGEFKGFQIKLVSW